MKRPIDRQQIDRLVLENLPAALRFATRLSGDVNQAEDLVQEALLRVLKRWKSCRSESNFRSWFFSIVINAHRDRCRKKSRETPLKDTPADPAPTPFQHAVASEAGDRVRDAIDRLPPRQREVAVTCIAEGLSPSQAAAVLQTTENNVNATLHAVRKRIAQALAAPGAQPK